MTNADDINPEPIQFTGIWHVNIDGKDLPLADNSFIDFIIGKPAVIEDGTVTVTWTNEGTLVVDEDGTT